MDRRIKILGRDVPVILLTIIAITSLASAALLSYYGTIVGTAQVKQSVLVDGKNYTTSVQDTIGEAIAGNSYTFKHYLTNRAEIGATVKLTADNPDTQNEEDYPEGVTVKYYEATCGDSLPDSIQCTENEIQNPESIEVGAEQNYCFCIEYIFAINAEPGDYDITTYVVPVTTQ